MHAITHAEHITAYDTQSQASDTQKNICNEYRSDIRAITPSYLLFLFAKMLTKHTIKYAALIYYQRTQPDNTTYMALRKSQVGNSQLTMQYAKHYLQFYVDIKIYINTMKKDT